MIIEMVLFVHTIIAMIPDALMLVNKIVFTYGKTGYTKIEQKLSLSIRNIC